MNHGRKPLNPCLGNSNTEPIGDPDIAYTGVGMLKHADLSKKQDQLAFASEDGSMKAMRLSERDKEESSKGNFTMRPCVYCPL